MLSDHQDVRLFGLRYRTIFVGLTMIGSLIVALMLLSLPSANVNGERPIAIDEVLSRIQNSWARLLVLSTILGMILTASVLTVFSYFSTTRHLTRIRTTSKAILESLVGGVLTIDMEGRITIINRAASRILELPSKAPYPDLDDLERKHRRLVEVIRLALRENQYVQDDDVAFVNSRAERLILRTTVSAQVDEHARTVGLVVLVKDVSKIVALEQELRKRDRLVTAGTLAAGVAHEIRNPLSAVELNLRLLRDEVASLLPGRADMEEYFDVLFAETQRLNRITSSFLQLSRPEELVKVTLPIHAPVQRVLRLIESEAKAKNISFSLDLQATGTQVLGDATKLEQVCLNLLINSMQAMPNGGMIRVTSSLGTSEKGGFVDLVVEDQGIGVPPENISRLFDPYFTTRTDGTGLGLAIADRIVTNHGGTILVESTLGAGTSMTVRLPIAEAPAAADGRQ
jgi:two-component system sensor histidine kinase HydH